jgi:hypothetical protein
MATRKRQNPFIVFAGKFRKANKGKYDFKQMGREAGKAWRKVKGGAEPRMPGTSPACIKASQIEALSDDFEDNPGWVSAKNKCRIDTARDARSDGGRSRRTQKRRR